MTLEVTRIANSFGQSIANSTKSESPYRHWFLQDCIPADIADGVLSLPFPAPELSGVSGKREIHNSTRNYFDQENQSKFSVCRDVCEVFQYSWVTSLIESTFDIDLDGTYLRIEYAQDTNGFWLEPHSDLGVKALTILLYLSKGSGHSDLGTDIYDHEKNHVGRSPFASGGAMVFVPSSNTMHGFEPRTIEGVRTSMIINYVTEDWRAREQLAFPNTPMRRRRLASAA